MHSSGVASLHAIRGVQPAGRNFAALVGVNLAVGVPHDPQLNIAHELLIGWTSRSAALLDVESQTESVINGYFRRAHV
jgi:hypothetical protein